MFSKRCFSEWCVQSMVRIRKGRRHMLENIGVFRHHLSLWRGFPLSKAEVRNLKNTVCKTPFGTLRYLHAHTGVMTSHTRKHAPKFVLPLDLLLAAVQIRVGLELTESPYDRFTVHLMQPHTPPLQEFKDPPT